MLQRFGSEGAFDVVGVVVCIEVFMSHELDPSRGPESDGPQCAAIRGGSVEGFWEKFVASQAYHWVMGLLVLFFALYGGVCWVRGEMPQASFYIGMATFCWVLKKL
jgi:hypothetical protein